MKDQPESLEYRVAHLADRLAAGEWGELGVRAEARGGAVLLTGTVPSAKCRDDIIRTARDVLADLPVHCDIVVAETAAPAHAEDLP
ncbi:BON domain-containing protein [Streptomyces crystallinus]|uniref:BON domain-containing protein n=1 Tax=Streptomyces crystallinus TaxID=68191 RepID=A0ABP3QPA5_9ACTN